MKRLRIRNAVFPIALAVAVVTTLYFAFTPIEHQLTDSVNDKLKHLLAFAVFAFLTDFSFPRTSLGFLKVLTLLGYGMFIEIVQYFLPYREFSMYDLLADGIGIGIYGFCQPLLRHIPWLRYRWQTSP